MNIFESLGSLEISEECFDEIMGLVEEIINEVSVNRWREAAANSIPGRTKAVKEGPYEYGRPATYNRKEGAFDQTNLVRLKRAKDIVSNFKGSKKPANKLVKGAENSIEDRDYNNMRDDIYGHAERDSAGRLKKAELALSANKKKYQKFRDQEYSEKNPHTPYDSSHYDERKGKHNQKVGEDSPELQKKG